MSEGMHVEVLSRTALPPALYQEIISLCSRAYAEPFAGPLSAFEDATHVVASISGELVSHALWVPRTLTYRGAPLRSAYVEAVATEPHHQGRGYASRVMRVLADAITPFALGALSPSDPAFYARLGWESWRGPLAVETRDGVTPTPDEDVMILRLDNTPSIDVDEPLTAPWREGDVW